MGFRGHEVDVRSCVKVDEIRCSSGFDGTLRFVRGNLHVLVCFPLRPASLITAEGEGDDMPHKSPLPHGSRDDEFRRYG